MRANERNRQANDFRWRENVADNGDRIQFLQMTSYLQYPYPHEGGNEAHTYLLPALRAVLGPPNKERIIDIGCGNGYVARELLGRGYDVIGLDASQEGIARAQTFFPDRFFVHEVGQPGLPVGFPSGTFDVAISLEVIEHIYDPRGFIDFCAQMLKRRGVLILSTPYHSYLKNLALAVSGKLDNHFTALWDSGHIKFWSRRTLTKLLAERGFVVTEFRGAGRIPGLWKSMLLKAELQERK
jgi:2-polyprenyl-3-methyl-5-hydroxy-6-metoxy-1,4-benzoquinol methylase